MSKGIKRQIQIALNNTRERISGTSQGKYGGGLASEGYMGGYNAALSDVLLLLGGTPPCRNPELWEKKQEKKP